jgi:hypothetical protein
MAGASSDFLDAFQRYPVMLLDGERIFGRLEDNTRPQIARPEKYVAPNFVRFRRLGAGRQSDSGACHDTAAYGRPMA